MDLPAGALFADRYRVKQKLGEGGMGAVFIAHDVLLDEDVALKVSSRGSDVASLARSRREVTLARRVTHPHVARVFDLGVHDGLVYLTMEYVPGTSLRRRLLRGPLCADDVIELGAQIASALVAAHDAGVAHLDLKPDNVVVVVGAIPRAVLVDFGVSRALGERATGAGSLDYMAPEQLGEEALGGATDIYALGLLLYELLTGTRPFGTGDDRVLARLTRKPALLPAPVPAELASIVDACLALHVGDRPSARTLEAELVARVARLARAAPDVSRSLAPHSAIGPVTDVATLPEGLGIALARARATLAIVGRELEAAAVFDDVLRHAPDLDVALAARALALVRAWNNAFTDVDVADRATVAVSEAVARAPHLADTHLADALIADAGGDFAYAVRALRRALARDPMHAFSHETLGCLELEAGVASDQRLRMAWALDDGHVGSAVHIARELFFRGRDDEAEALLRSIDQRGALHEAQLLRTRACVWRADKARAAALLAGLVDDGSVITAGISTVLRYVVGELSSDAIRALLDHMLALGASPKRKAYLLQIFVELMADVDEASALAALLSAAHQPLADLRWFDACPALAPLRASPTFHIARAMVQLRIEDTFGVSVAPSPDGEHSPTTPDLTTVVPRV